MIKPMAATVERDQPGAFRMSMMTVAANTVARNSVFVNVVPVLRMFALSAGHVRQASRSLSKCSSCRRSWTWAPLPALFRLPGRRVVHVRIQGYELFFDKTYYQVVQGFGLVVGADVVGGGELSCWAVWI